MAEEKILTKHPLGKSGKNINKQKYETLKKAILSRAARQRTHSHRIVQSAEQELKEQVPRDCKLVWRNR